jgi:hypothetical protein
MHDAGLIAIRFFILSQEIGCIVRFGMHFLHAMFPAVSAGASLALFLPAVGPGGAATRHLPVNGYRRSTNPKDQ